MKTANAARTLEISKSLAGQDRANYFAQPGATVNGWRGTHLVQTNRKHHANRHACRNSSRRFED